VAMAVALLASDAWGDDAAVVLDTAAVGSGYTLQSIIITGTRMRDVRAIDSAAPVRVIAGGAGSDLNFIPANAIDHIEVLTAIPCAARLWITSSIRHLPRGAMRWQGSSPSTPTF
jgi:hypothetical protein